MSKLLTVYDDVDPLNNVISALTIKAEKVIFVHHHEIPDKNIRAIHKVLTRYIDTEIVFVELTDDIKQLKEIIDTNDDLVIDIGGAKYLSLLLFEVASKIDNEMIYYDDDENRLMDYRSHKVITEDVFSLQIEDVINLGGGEIVSYMHKAADDKGSKETVRYLVENNLDNYNSFIRYITKINTIISNSPSLGHNTYKLSDDDVQSITTDMCYRKIGDLFTIDEKNKLKFKNGKLRDMVSVSGSFLENYLYIKLTDSGKFDDVKMSVVIDFSDAKYKYPIRCELDGLIIRHNKLLFVSCKSNKADTEALNEIYVHNRHFGNVLSLPVLCVCEEMDRKFPSTYCKGEELGVYLIDRSSFLENDICDVFLSVFDGTYVYDVVI